MSLTENGLVLAVQRGDHRDRICIYWFATLPTGLLTPMAGGGVVAHHGLSINGNRFGLHFRPLSMRMCIHQVLRLLFRRHLPQASLLMMAQPTSMKSPTSAGRISLIAVPRAASCVPPDRVPPRRPVPRNGLFRKVQRVEFTLFTSVSLRCAQQRKALSIRFVTREKMIR